MQENTLQEISLAPEVVSALSKFEGGIDLNELTLEEIMMCTYKVLCRKISPQAFNHPRAMWGSVLVKADEVILVLNPEDESVYMPIANRHYRFIGIKREFGGFLPGSRIYTQDTLTWIHDPQDVRDWRLIDRRSGKKLKTPSDAFPLATEGENNAFFKRFRCPEVVRLMGRRAGGNIKKALKKSG
jgi:hypothetical protein